LWGGAEDLAGKPHVGKKKRERKKERKKDIGVFIS
jgi:hypothetical protein